LFFEDNWVVLRIRSASVVLVNSRATLQQTLHLTSKKPLVVYNYSKVYVLNRAVTRRTRCFCIVPTEYNYRFRINQKGPKLLPHNPLIFCYGDED